MSFLDQGPKLSTLEDISAVKKGQPEVFRKLEQDDIVVVWGRREQERHIPCHK